MTRAIVLFLVPVAMVAVTDCSGGGAVAPVRQDITAARLQAMLDDGEPLQLVDVRTPREFAVSAIPGAINIPVDQIKGPVEDLAALDRNMRTVAYCASGNRSVTASQSLLELGFTQVHNLLGGIQGWPGVTEAPSCGCKQARLGPHTGELSCSSSSSP